MPARRDLRRRLATAAALAAGLLAAAVATGCNDEEGGAATATSAASSTTIAPEDLGTTAVAATSAAGSAAVRVEVTGPGGDVVATGEGALDWVAGRGRLVQSFAEADGALTPAVELVHWDGANYERPLDGAAPAQQVSGGVATFLGLAAGGDDAPFDEALTAQLTAGDFVVDGTGTAGGEAVARYRAERGGDVVEVDVDGDGRVRRLTVARRGPPASTTTVELSEFGVAVEAAPPSTVGSVAGG